MILESDSLREYFAGEQPVSSDNTSAISAVVNDSNTVVAKSGPVPVTAAENEKRKSEKRKKDGKDLKLANKKKPKNDAIRINDEVLQH